MMQNKGVTINMDHDLDGPANFLNFTKTGFLVEEMNASAEEVLRIGIRIVLYKFIDVPLSINNEDNSDLFTFDFKEANSAPYLVKRIGNSKFLMGFKDSALFKRSQVFKNHARQKFVKVPYVHSSIIYDKLLIKNVKEIKEVTDKGIITKKLNSYEQFFYSMTFKEKADTFDCRLATQTKDGQLYFFDTASSYKMDDPEVVRGLMIPYNLVNLQYIDSREIYLEHCDIDKFNDLVKYIEDNDVINIGGDRLNTDTKKFWNLYFHGIDMDFLKNWEEDETVFEIIPICAIRGRTIGPVYINSRNY